ncbi:hypothetical protein ACFLW1_02495 [Chloroflexota bacterium]
MENLAISGKAKVVFRLLELKVKYEQAALERERRAAELKKKQK